MLVEGEAGNRIAYCLRLPLGSIIIHPLRYHGVVTYGTSEEEKWTQHVRAAPSSHSCSERKHKSAGAAPTPPPPNPRSIAPPSTSPCSWELVHQMFTHVVVTINSDFAVMVTVGATKVMSETL